MNVDGKSDESVVPLTRANNAGTEPAAESAEGRDAAKRNVDQSNQSRAPKRKRGRSHGLARHTDWQAFAKQLGYSPSFSSRHSFTTSLKTYCWKPSSH